MYFGFFDSNKGSEYRKLFGFHIALASSLIKEFFLKEAHKSTVHSLSLVLSILAVIFCGLSEGINRYLGIIFLTSSYLVINILLFNAGLIFPILSPIVAIIFGVLLEKKFCNKTAYRLTNDGCIMSLCINQ